MGIRLILLAVVLWVLFSAMRRFSRQRRHVGKKTAPRDPVNMVICKICGIHLPQHDAIQHDGNYYCCIEHSDSDEKEKEEQ